jgi:hypothetical protein
MKYSLATLALVSIIFFSKCNKKDCGQPAPQPEKESWQPMSREQVFHNARHIITSATDDGHLMFFAYNRSYVFDSSFKEPGSYNYMYNSPGYQSNELQYKAGPGFRVFNLPAGQTIVITLNQNANSSALTSLSASEINGKPGRISGFSAPDADDNFYVTVTSGSASDTEGKSFLLYKYHITAVQGITVEKNLLWQAELATGIHNVAHDVIAVNAVDDICFVTTSEKTYRIENGTVTDSTIISLRDVEKYGTLYMATCAWRASATVPQEIYPDGLVLSRDQGHSWEYAGTGEAFPAGQLISTDHKLFLNSGTQISLIDFENNALKPLVRSADINAHIWTMNLFKGNIYLGTDAGVYYKSWEGFLNP